MDLKLKLPREELIDIISDHDAIIVRSATKVHEELFIHRKNLKVVGRAGNGVDNINITAVDGILKVQFVRL